MFLGRTKITICNDHIHNAYTYVWDLRHTLRFAIEIFRNTTIYDNGVTFDKSVWSNEVSIFHVIYFLFLSLSHTLSLFLYLFLFVSCFIFTKDRTILIIYAVVLSNHRQPTSVSWFQYGCLQFFLSSFMYITIFKNLAYFT